MEPFETLESRVRSYSRSFPTVFATARGATLVDRDGRRFLDFFAGAGALNYGHNPPQLKPHLLAYLEADGITHGLDMATTAKAAFLERFDEVVLRPRGLEYRLQFPGPTGTNAVEAALKLARKVTGRQTVVCFHNGFHGMTLGALAVSGNLGKRAGAGTALHGAVAMPYDGDLGPEVDSLVALEAALENPGSGVEKPAAVIVETVQAEGGVRVARTAWLQRLARLARRHGLLLIADEIQVGCGRTGPFFSFEPAGLVPDLVCLSKSLSGYGLPLSLVLVRPDLDRWEPGEHNGTFRGNNPAFVTATAALETFWRDDALSRSVAAGGRRVDERLTALAARLSGEAGAPRGRGLIRGLPLLRPGLAGRVSAEAFRRGLIVETAGPRGEVLKLLPPLTVEPRELERGLDLVEESVEAALRAGLGEAPKEAAGKAAEEALPTGPGEAPSAPSPSAPSPSAPALP